MKINYQYNRTWKAMLTFIMGVLLSGCAGEDAFNGYHRNGREPQHLSTGD